MGGLRNKVKILKNVTVLREGKNGWTQELNLVSWYDGQPKFDIRWWSKDKTETGKGATLRPEEFMRLKEAITDLPEDFHLVL